MLVLNLSESYVGRELLVDFWIRHDINVAHLGIHSFAIWSFNSQERWNASGFVAGNNVISKHGTHFVHNLNSTS